MSHNVGGYIDTGAGEEAEAFDAGDYTSNCERMWACAISGTFDDPKTRLVDLHNKNCGELVPILTAAREHMEDPANRERYEAMNPANGWGGFDSARNYLIRILLGCRRHPLAHLNVSRG
jgi:hypothetical protein